ncbi:MAG: Helix-turn-helix domain [Actinomycetota bacterium]|jgi:excisionase family DNA binding protein|nr:Helix-turn-helix domain [Actinomycetota bacterium]
MANTELDQTIVEHNPLLTIDQVAGLLGVSHLTVYRLIKRGRLRALRVGKFFRLRTSDVAAYMEAGSTEEI